MMRQASARNLRSKGLRVKNVLRICLLVALCIWLLYQMKHSYDKKKTLDERNTRILSDVVDSQPDFVDFAMKDLPRNKVVAPGDKAYDKEKAIEGVEEEEEDREIQQTMDDEEAKGIEDDGIDEQDHEQDDRETVDEEAEDGEEFVDEEDEVDQVEEAEFLEDQEHDEGSSQEAREKIYKRDDASSAVLQENQVTGTEDKNDSVEEEQQRNNEKDMETRDTIGRKDDDPKDNNDASATVVVATGNETMQNNSLTTKGAAVEKTGQELSPVDNQTKPQANTMIVANVSDNQVKLHTDSPVAVTSNETEGETDTVPVENGTLSMSSTEDQNTTIALGSPEEDNSQLKSMVEEEQLKKSNTTVGQDNLEELSTVSLAMNENGDAVEGDSAGSSHRMVI